MLVHMTKHSNGASIKRLRCAFGSMLSMNKSPLPVENRWRIVPLYVTSKPYIISEAAQENLSAPPLSFEQNNVRSEVHLRCVLIVGLQYITC